MERLAQGNITELEKKARITRALIIESIYHAASGHPGGSLSIVEILTYLYNTAMNVDPKKPDRPDRDRLVLSKGDGAPALYAALALRGFFPVQELSNLRKIGGHLQGHPDMKGTPGIDMTTGSLGQGISCACGMALAAKMRGDSYRTYAVLGDGELQEGQVWEAAMFAGAKGLSNLTAFVDYNNLQISGRVSDTLNVAPIDAKFAAFGWHTQTIDGHDFAAIHDAVLAAAADSRPSVIICMTKKGRGVSFMEDNYLWHGSPPNKEQRDTALAELGIDAAKLLEAGL